MKCRKKKVLNLMTSMTLVQMINQNQKKMIFSEKLSARKIIKVNLRNKKTKLIFQILMIFLRKNN